MSSVTQSVQFKNISATTAAFPLKGGKYALLAIGAGGAGTFDFQSLAADNSTWVPPITQITAASFAQYLSIDLSPGQYRFAITTYTGVYISLTSVPY
jgi:hypothetical protein